MGRETVERLRGIRPAAGVERRRPARRVADGYQFRGNRFPDSPAVAKDRYAIGYAGLAYVGEGVKLLALSPQVAHPFSRRTMRQSRSPTIR